MGAEGRTTSEGAPVALGPGGARRPGALHRRAHWWVGLVVADADGLHRIDLDRSPSESIRLDGAARPPCDGILHPTSLVVRRDYLAFVQCDTAHAAPLGSDGPARQLGPASIILPSLRPEAVWLVAQKEPNGEGIEVTEVDGEGNVLTPPWRLPRYTNLVGAVPGGLLLWATTAGSRSGIPPDGSSFVASVRDSRWP